MALKLDIIHTTLQPTSVKYSIIIVNYNNFDDIKRCLKSVTTNTDLSTAEIILVNNDATNKTIETIQRQFPKVIFIQSPKNLGFGYGNNLGASIAKGKYLIFLNPDTVVTKGWLEKLIEGFDLAPDVGLVTPKILLLSNPSLINACGHQVHYTGIVQCRGLYTPKQNFFNIEDLCAVSGAAFAVKADIFNRIDGFDSPFFLFIEDTDISWRAQLAGYRCVYIPDSIIYHDYTLAFWPSKMFYYERNRYMLLIKNYKLATLLSLLPILLFAETIVWGFILLKHHRCWREKLQAYKWVLHNWKVILTERKKVQATRRVKDRTLLQRSTYKLAFEQTLPFPIAIIAHIIIDPIFLIYKGFLYMFIH